MQQVQQESKANGKEAFKFKKLLEEIEQEEKEAGLSEGERKKNRILSIGLLICSGLFVTLLLVGIGFLFFQGIGALFGFIFGSSATASVAKVV